MASFFRRFLPTNPSDSSFGADDEYSMEYSFAMQYNGPPVNYDIPRVVPVDVGRIPTAAEVSTSSLSNLSLPVVQPVAKKRKDHMIKKLSDERLSGLQAAANSPISVMDSGGFDEAREVRLSSVQGASFRVVNVIDDSGESGYSDGCEFITRRVLNRNESSGTSGFSDSLDNSHELSRNSDVECVSDGEGEGLASDLDEAGLRSSVVCSEITEEEESVHEAKSSHHRTQIVTFRDPELSDIVHRENDQVESVVVQEKQRSTSNVKKGLCHLCLKGNRFTQKEACLVCGAKYCYKCVIRAMGSMPEGRKCVTCIGYRIDETKRATLGKCSRLLKRLHVNARSKEIMRHEISCKANQFPPELIYVNGRSLTEAELVELLCCPNPPKNLEPRKYWYDKVSGLWGKEGKKPCQIISAQLSVGDPIMPNASNGSTDILVNNRAITKSERWMLELAGINCEGKPHFWMSADGSFQEEGQNNVMKQKLFKRRIKLLSVILSLPIPSETAHSGTEEDDRVTSKVATSNLEQKKPYKFLMVGSEKSGTSTIFKQARILYNSPFSEDERQEIKSVIQSKLYYYIGILLEDRERFEEESLNKMRIEHADQLGPSGIENTDPICEENIYSINKRLRAFSDWLLQVMMSGNLDAIFPASAREYAPLVEELWKDKAIQATYKRKNEMQVLPQGVSYFLNRAIEISRVDYEPSDIDILYAEGITSSNGIASMEFSFPQSVQDSYMDTTDHSDPLKRYQLIRVHSSSLGKNCKWLQMFEEVDLVIYCVSLTDYCQFSYNANGDATNNMLKSKNLFETIVNHPISSDKDFLLILTKFDLFEESIEQVPLTLCEWLRDFNPVLSSNPNSNSGSNSNPSLAQRAFHYIASKFKAEFYSLTGNRLYVSRVNGLEAECVDEALNMQGRF
ncbi:extra-large guanine nucleotide-binding protein 1-like [Apium graveolens]|uniref:extra-large guanine nucleotide-binding protein 1-like n=1 Tax=Apium graveolens TaxID=4045 RepID=UPI003D7B4C60